MTQYATPSSKAHGPKQTHLFIDGEREETDSHALTVTEMLALVDKPPTEWYVVEKDGRTQVTHKDPAELVDIKPGAKFITVFTGPTPVS